MSIFSCSRSNIFSSYRIIQYLNKYIYIMNSPGKKVLELAEIAALLEGSKCPHYKYDDVLKHLGVILESPLPNISFQEELTLEKLLLEVFHIEKFNPDDEGFQCKGCNYAFLIIEVLRSRKSLKSIVSTLYKTLNFREFKSSFID